MPYPHYARYSTSAEDCGIATSRRANQQWELVGEFSGLTPMQRDTLDQLRLSGGQTPSDAARFWNVSRQSMMDRFGALVSKGVAYSTNGVYHAK
jgi:hypothetical protein